jgi:hypothetical protein
MVVVNVNQLLIEDVVICDKRGEEFDFGDFIPLWTVAEEIAQEDARDELEGVATLRRA